MIHNIIIGIDESYTRTSATLFLYGEYVRMYDANFINCKNNYQKRIAVKRMLETIITDNVYKNFMVNYEQALSAQWIPLIIVERLRTFTGNNSSRRYLCQTSALIATIIDYFARWNVPVYSVDTRTWKRCIVGTDEPQKNKYGIDPKKYKTILYVKKKGLLKDIIIPYKGRGKKGVVKCTNSVNKKVASYLINDDRADSYCIAECGLLPDVRRQEILQLENW